MPLDRGRVLAQADRAPRAQPAACSRLGVALRADALAAGGSSPFLFGTLGCPSRITKRTNGGAAFHGLSVGRHFAFEFERDVSALRRHRERELDDAAFQRAG